MHGSKCKGGGFDCSLEEKRSGQLLCDIEGADRAGERSLIPLFHSVEQSALQLSFMGRRSYLEYVSVR
jgi:hypothetical protein